MKLCKIFKLLRFAVLPMRTVWTSVFPDCFLPSLVRITKNELSFKKPKNVKPTDKFPDLWKPMVIQPLIPKAGYAEIPYNVYYPAIQKNIAKTIYKDYGTHFPAVKLHRKGNGCPGVIDVVDGNVSENKKEKNLELEREETQPSPSNTAPILDMFEILAEMSSIDDDS